MRFSVYTIISAIFFLLLTGSLFFAPKTYAASLVNVSDLLSTSRPSASAPLIMDSLASTQSAVVFDNKSFYLASDSAIFRADTGETQDTVTVASMSAAVGGNRYVYFSTSASNTHHRGGVLVVPITAMHRIKFTTIAAVPVSGKITLSFPALTSGDANTAASPSATTFQLNAIPTNRIFLYSGSTDITSSSVIAVNNPASGTSPNITLTLNSSTSIAANTAVTIYLGCSASASVSTCTNDARIINPTKTAAAGTGDIWTLTITTSDSSAGTIDSAKTRIATIDQVFVQATIDPTLTVTIAGLGNAANYNTSSGSCGSETTNSGIAASATVVDLGTLGTTINKAGQTITVSTNSQFGYTITATSSGRFADPSTGFFLPDANIGTGLTANDTPAPAAITAGTPVFGISPCGARVPTSSPDWGGSSGTLASGAKLSNPYNTGLSGYYATIASYTAGPVSSDITVIRYGATISATTPAGLYSNYFTYVVTPTF